MIERPGLAPETALDGHAARASQDYLVEPVADGEVLDPRRGRRAHQGAPARARRPGRAAGGAAARGRAHRALQPARDPDPAGRAWSPAPAVTATRSRSRSATSTTSSAINDSHGHKTGDEVLVAAAHAMGAHLRAEDQLGPARRRGVPRPAARHRRAAPPGTWPRSCAPRSPRARDARAGHGQHRAWPPGTARRRRSCFTAPTRRSTRPRTPGATGSWLLPCTAAHDHDRRGKARDRLAIRQATRPTRARPRSRWRCSRIASTT